VLELLRNGELEIVGRLTDASNATFLCRIGNAGDEDSDAWPEGQERPSGPLCVYKPVRGERPLDDFPNGTLARREVAAYLVSEASGWGIVPATVMRDGPFGEGAVQDWIETDPDVDPFDLVTSFDDRLRRVCLFDAVVNNADRKGSHLLPTATGTVLGVDHGICFSADPKLRTVLWAWRGEPIDDDELAIIRRVCNAIDGALGRDLGELLSEREVRATQRRAEQLLREGTFPQPDPLRPAVPWPPF
jgi:uncharacterized repeat protein (TIGR03843 family)